MDNLASFFLFLGNGIVLVPILLFGLIVIDRRFFYQLGCLVLISILINVALKVSFQIPLPSHLAKNWFAFPSGHMQMATVFYGWLAYRVPSTWFRMSMMGLLLGIGFSLIYFDYHTSYDVIAAFFAALFIIAAYQLLLSRASKISSIILAILALGLLLYIELMYQQIPSHSWMAFYALWGFILGKKVNSEMFQLSLPQRLLNFLMCISSLLLIHFLFMQILMKHLPFIQQSEWCLISFIAYTFNQITPLISKKVRQKAL